LKQFEDGAILRQELVSKPRGLSLRIATVVQVEESGGRLGSRAMVAQFQTDFLSGMNCD